LTILTIVFFVVVGKQVDKTLWMWNMCISFKNSNKLFAYNTSNLLFIRIPDKINI